MKKIVITGHTQGIGAYLAENIMHDVTGFSRSTGVDIGTEEGKETVLDALDYADVFINNAFNFTEDKSQWDNDDQLDLLRRAYNKTYPEDWRSGFFPDKQNEKLLIINIGSFITELPDERIPRAAQHLFGYKQAKVRQQEYIRGRRIVNIAPGLTKSNLISGPLADAASSPEPILGAVKYAMDSYFKNNVICNSVILL